MAGGGGGAALLAGLLAQAPLCGAVTFQAESAVPGLLAVTEGGGGRMIKPEAGLSWTVSMLEAADAGPACAGEPPVLAATDGVVRMLEAGPVGLACLRSAGRALGVAGSDGHLSLVAMSGPKRAGIAAESSGGWLLRGESSGSSTSPCVTSASEKPMATVGGILVLSAVTGHTGTMPGVEPNRASSA